MQKIFLHIIILFLFPSIVFAENISIIAIEIEGLHSKDLNGVYDKSIAKIKPHMKNDSIKVKRYPPQRAFWEFRGCTYCCISPANLNAEFYDFTDEKYIVTKSLGIAKIYFFANPKLGIKTSNLETIKELRVGGRIGMPYGRKIETKNLWLLLTTTIEQNIKKTLADRIDGFIAYIPDAIDAFAAVKIDTFPYDKENPISVHKDQLVCKRNPVMEKFVANFNNTLDDLEKKGEFTVNE